MSLGLVALFVDKNRHDPVSFVSAATVGSENLSVFRTVLPSRKFHVDSKSGSGKPLEKNSFVWFVLANSQSFRVVTVSGDYNQCSQLRLAYLACLSSGLEQRFKPVFLTPPACLSKISVRLIACKQFEQA
jgi:hypothetical protein